MRGKLSNFHFFSTSEHIHLLNTFKHVGARRSKAAGFTAIIYLLKLGMIWGRKLERGTEGGFLPSVHGSVGISIGTRREESNRRFL